MVEVGIALVMGVVIGVGVHLWWGPVGAAPAPVAEVAGATITRSGPVPDELVGTVAPAVVRVHAEGCGGRRQGSATLVRGVDGEAQLLTNAHVAKGASTVTVDLATGATAEVAVLGSVEGRDATRLDATPLLDAGIRALPVAGPAEVGDPVVVAGHPAGSFRVDGTSVSTTARRAAYGGASDVLLVGAVAEGGHSGGAVLDPAGNVVGLVAARDPSTSQVVAYRIQDVVDEPLGGVPTC